MRAAPQRLLAWRMPAALLLAALAWLPSPARAEPAAAYIMQDLPMARLAGHGEFRWFGLSIYTARLWVGPAGYQPAAPVANAFFLELDYARALDGKKIAEASAEQIEKLGIGSTAQRHDWLQQMRAAFPDVRRGDRLAGLFMPGAGARFYLNERILTTIADAEFAHAFFAIWLSPAGSAPTLRKALLQDASVRR